MPVSSYEGFKFCIDCGYEHDDGTDDDDYDHENGDGDDDDDIDNDGGDDDDADGKVDM